MNRYGRDLTLFLGQLDPRRARLALLVLSLVLFVLGAGAPGSDGGSNGGG
jgi:hypothetical protein